MSHKLECLLAVQGAKVIGPESSVKEKRRYAMKGDVVEVEKKADADRLIALGFCKSYVAEKPKVDLEAEKAAAEKAATAKKSNASNNKDANLGV